MNGFLVISLESGLLMCSRSYVHQNFGLEKMGCDHFHLAATLFAFYKLANDFSVTTKSYRNEDLHSETTSNGQYLAVVTDIQENALKWVKFGDVFILFQELHWEMQTARPLVLKESSMLLILVSKRTDLEEDISGIGNSRDFVEKIALINRKVYENYAYLASLRTREYGWLANIVDEVICPLVPSKEDLEKVISKNTQMKKLYWSALTSDDDNQEYGYNAVHKEKNSQPKRSSFLQIITSIPIRLIRAILKMRESDEREISMTI
jgi:hypothetical protein